MHLAVRISDPAVGVVPNAVLTDKSVDDEGVAEDEDE